MTLWDPVSGWLVQVAGDAGVRLVRGTDDERALRRAVAVAVDAVVERADPAGREALRRGLRECFSSPPALRVTGGAPVGVELREVIRAQVGRLDRMVGNDTGRPFADEAGIDVGQLADQVAEAMVAALRQVVAEGGLAELVRGLDAAETAERLDALDRRIGDLSATTRAVVELLTDRAGPRRPWMVPPLDGVVERPELGARLLDALTSSAGGEVSLTTGLHGAGGFGKTTMAAWAGHQPEVRRSHPGGLLWVTVGQETHGTVLAERINDLAFALTGERPALSDPDAAGAELGRLLDERDRTLLVVDDVWDAAQLRPFRYGGRACTRLVTTRAVGLLPGARIQVDAMSAAESRRLLRLGLAGLPDVAADRLAAVAGHWPVLLSLVNGGLRRRVGRGQPVGEAADETLRLLTAHGPAVLDPSRPADRARAVTATMEASLVLLGSDDRERYHDLALFPEDVDIPLNVLALLWPPARVHGLCEELAELGLVADFRMDAPGPRLVLHDVVRAYLRNHRTAERWVADHARLVDAARTLLPAPGDHWWLLPQEVGYLWRFLARHLHEAGLTGELDALVTDLRWVEAAIRRSGSAVGVVGDLGLSDTPTALALRRAVRRSAHVLGPIEPSGALAATLVGRLHGVPGLEAVLDRYRTGLGRPRLEPAWPLPDRPSSEETDPSLGHTGGVTGCVFSPDGTLLATTSDDQSTRLWRISDGTCRVVLTGHSGGVWGSAFSPDGTLLATTGDDRTVRLWRLPEGTPEAVLIGHDGWVQNCAFSPDGTILASVGNDGTARLWRMLDGAPLQALAGHGGRVLGCAFSPDGALLATAGDDRTVRLWRIADGVCVTVLAGHDGPVWTCAFSPDGTLLATGADDATARLWTVADATCRAVLRGHAGRVTDCAFSPDGALLATTGHDDDARLWRVRDGAAVSEIAGHTAWIRGCAFSPDGTLLATASYDGTARLWRVGDAAPVAVLGGASAWVRGSAFSPDGSLLATTGDDRAATLWQVATGRRLTTLTGHTSRVNYSAFSPDGTLLATTSADHTVRLWAMDGPSLSAVLTGHGDGVNGCAFSSDGTLLATASNDNTVRLWRMPGGEPHQILEGHTAAVNDCAFSPDGTLLATASSDSTVRLWRMPGGELHEVVEGHTDVVNGCAFNRDGTLLATAGDDETVGLWRMPDGASLAMLTGHTGWVDRCVFDPGGSLLATASNDGTIRVWDPVRGRCEAALRVAGPVTGIAWHPGEPLICAGGGAGAYVLAYLDRPGQDRL